MNITVYIGTRNKYSDGTPIGCRQMLWGVTIDGKSLLSAKLTTAQSLQDSVPELVESIDDAIKKEGGVSLPVSYSLVNGQRLRHTITEIVPCDPVSQADLECFKSALDRQIAA